MWSEETTVNGTCGNRCFDFRQETKYSGDDLLMFSIQISLLTNLIQFNETANGLQYQYLL